jgi:tRNA (guanine-N7-)-methyltransferase
VLLDDRLSTSQIDPTAIFGNRHLVELEVGSGKGAFLLARAAARPELNFLGVELAKAYCHYAADRIRRRGLTNVRMLCIEAAHLFQVCLPNACLWRVHVYFPDPWPKRRHHRRRLINPAFLAQVRRVLQPGGQLLIVTDHQEYFLHIQRVVSGAEGFARIALPSMTADNGELAGTNFERKYTAQGRPFYAAARMRYG